MRASTVTIQSVAVLPLDNLSGDQEQDFFADGMTDELITMLAKISSLRVVSRTSVMQYKGVHRPLREIAQELGVEGIVEGSVEPLIAPWPLSTFSIVGTGKAPIESLHARWSLTQVAPKATTCADIYC